MMRAIKAAGADNTVLYSRVGCLCVDSDDNLGARFAMILPPCSWAAFWSNPIQLDGQLLVHQPTMMSFATSSVSARHQRLATPLLQAGLPRRRSLCVPRLRASAESHEVAAERDLAPLQLDTLEQQHESTTVAPSMQTNLPRQGDAVVAGVQDAERIGLQLMEILKPPSDVDYLQEFLAIQNNGPKNIGFFGTRNMGFMHQQLIEVLSYAIVLTGNHIFTSGATGTNAAVIRGALRAERPELLTVVLPQSLSKQPQESQELLKEVQNLISMPQNDELTLMEASRICNQDIIGRVKQVICFAFHDSNLLLETCQQAREQSRVVTLFYLD